MPFYTQVVPVTVREAGYVLDGLLGHGSSLKIETNFGALEATAEHVLAVRKTLPICTVNPCAKSLV